MSNAELAERSWPAAVVAGGSMTGVVLMRTLARRGVRVACFDSDASAPGFRTAYGAGHLCPDFDEQPNAWLDFALGVAGQFGARPVLISSADVFVTAIAKFAHELEGKYTFCQSAASVQGLLATKEKQYSLAAEHDLAVPRTQLVSSLDDVREFGLAATFPCLLKPLHAREWERAPAGHPLRGAKVAVASALEELMGRYKQAAELGPRVIAQETIPGADTDKLVYISCYSGKGDRLGHSLVRELRTTPIHFGAASVVEPASEGLVEAACDRFLRRIGYAGLCEIELKRDRRDGQTKMIEANPRFSVTADASQYAGVDVGWLHYLDLAGMPVSPVEPRRGDFRHVVLRRDLVTIPEYLRQGLVNWRQLLRSYRPPIHFWDFDLHDWRVTAENVAIAFRGLAVATARAFRAR
jgi:predicted ATP-grasp superfamily ATP-dependent carboligase